MATTIRYKGANPIFGTDQRQSVSGSTTLPTAIRPEPSRWRRDNVPVIDLMTLSVALYNSLKLCRAAAQPSGSTAPISRQTAPPRSRVSWPSTKRSGHWSGCLSEVVGHAVDSRQPPWLPSWAEPGTCAEATGRISVARPPVVFTGDLHTWSAGRAAASSRSAPGTGRSDQSQEKCAGNPALAECTAQPEQSWR